MSLPSLQCGRFQLTLNRPLIMGIVNLTPDSFSGDGVGNNTARALEHAQKQIEAGADLLDLGAESSRPGATPTPLQEELERLLPVLEKLSGCGLPLSVDTYKPEVMRAALAAGADMINDITAFSQPGALETVVGSRCGLCLMHMQGKPLTMQTAPVYQDVVAEVAGFWRARLAATDAMEIDRQRIVLDPGFGFGKTLAHNIELFRGLENLSAGITPALPLLVGVSRKSMIGALTGKPATDRVAGSVAAALAAVTRGAAIVRVHDVEATRDALAVWQVLQIERNNDVQLTKETNT